MQGCKEVSLSTQGCLLIFIRERERERDQFTEYIHVMAVLWHLQERVSKCFTDDVTLLTVVAGRDWIIGERRNTYCPRWVRGSPSGRERRWRLTCDSAGRVISHERLRSDWIALAYNFENAIYMVDVCNDTCNDEGERRHVSWWDIKRKKFSLPSSPFFSFLLSFTWKKLFLKGNGMRERDQNREDCFKYVAKKKKLVCLLMSNEKPIKYFYGKETEEMPLKQNVTEIRYAQPSFLLCQWKLKKSSPKDSWNQKGLRDKGAIEKEWRKMRQWWRKKGSANLKVTMIER